MAENRLFSFEFSAPKTDEAIEKVKKVHARLSELSPHFFSVTYGAGGSTKDGTKQTVLDLSTTGTIVAPHLSFGGDKPEVIEALLNDKLASVVTSVDETFAEIVAVIVDPTPNVPLGK